MELSSICRLYCCVHMIWLIVPSSILNQAFIILFTTTIVMWIVKSIAEMACCCWWALLRVAMLRLVKCNVVVIEEAYCATRRLRRLHLTQSISEKWMAKVVRPLLPSKKWSMTTLVFVVDKVGKCKKPKQKCYIRVSRKPFSFSFLCPIRKGLTRMLCDACSDGSLLWFAKSTSKVGWYASVWTSSTRHFSDNAGMHVGSHLDSS